MRDRSLEPRGGLPGELSGFIGRRAELGRVRAALGVARLVTMTGPGGIGKTRLAVQVAAEVRRRFRDGAWMVELAGLRDPGLLAPQVARGAAGWRRPRCQNAARAARTPPALPEEKPQPFPAFPAGS